MHKGELLSSRPRPGAGRAEGGPVGMGALCDDDDMYVEARKTALAAQQEEHTQMKQHEIHGYKQES